MSVRGNGGTAPPQPRNAWILRATIAGGAERSTASSLRFGMHRAMAAVWSTCSRYHRAASPRSSHADASPSPSSAPHSKVGASRHRRQNSVKAPPYRRACASYEKRVEWSGAPRRAQTAGPAMRQSQKRALR
eukprot:3251284-Prymnesium_polylepis.1